jgi:hypothetical protein
MPRGKDTFATWNGFAIQVYCSPLDLDRADALCDYLVEIHQISANEPGLYTRRIRELVGHGECIMGIADPSHPLITPPEAA